MPQLDISQFPTQLIWLAICFVALYLVLSRVAIPRIGAVIEERQRRVDADLAKAAALKADAEAAMAAYEKAMVEARAGARDLMRKAADAIAHEAEERQKVLGDKLAAQIKAGEDRIGETKRQALAEIEAVAAGLARDVAEKLAGIATDDARANSAVRAARAEARALEAH